MKRLVVLVSVALMATACGGSSKTSSTATSLPAGPAATNPPTPTTGQSVTTVAAGGAVAVASVVWSGGETAPAITITGTGFGSRPSPDPAGPPSQLGSSDPRLKCIPVSGEEGLNFGTQLYVFTADNNFSAGRYRPSIGENDCVGFVVDEYTDGRVKVHLGAAYAVYRGQNNYTIRNGYRYEIAVKGTLFNGVVQYT